VVTGEVGEGRDVVVVVHGEVAVGHHRTPAVPPAAAHDVHARRAERVGRAHHGADVVVVPEVLDGDVERVRAGGQVVGHRGAPPVAVGVDDVARVAVGEQLGVVVAVGGPVGGVARPRPHPTCPGTAHSVAPGDSSSGPAMVAG
jgi:hypothetical protein